MTFWDGVITDLDADRYATAAPSATPVEVPGGT
jgi:hypothetical protein